MSKQNNVQMAKKVQMSKKKVQMIKKNCSNQQKI